MKTPAGFRDLVADRRLVLVLAGAALIQSSHAMSYGFATLYWKSQGFDATLIGVFWAVGVVAETVLFASASRFGGSAVPLLMILAGGIAAVLRWATFAVIDSTPVWTIAQLLHALSFAATYLGTIQYLARAAPERLSGRAQGLSITVNGIAMVAATLASGPLYKALGGGAFTLMSGLALAGTLLILALLRRPQPHSAGSGGCTIEPS
jgi:PPP family 3-phenylpropionic acid transporter